MTRQGSDSDEDKFGSPESAPRTRLWVRRWRLWWRTRLRSSLAWASGRMRPIRGPDDSQPWAAKLQLRVSRFLGRSYLRTEELKERHRVRRSTIPDRLAEPKLWGALVGAQKGILNALIYLVLLSFGMDLLVRRYGGNVTEALGITDWLSRNTNLPGDETLRNSLVAAASATGAILALVLTISLIVWQTTAERFGSSRIVEFLLRERVGATVVRLLALSFSFSLWVLGLFELLEGHRPYVSVYLALTLSTVGVVSLLTYQRHALLGYVPRNTFDQLISEIVREIRRACSSGGRSVPYSARRLATQDLYTAGDLLRRLRRDDEPESLGAGIEALGRMCITYQGSKKLSLTTRCGSNGSTSRSGMTGMGWETVPSDGASPHRRHRKPTAYG